MRRISLAIVAILAASSAAAQQAGKLDPARVDAAFRTAFPAAPLAWQPRLTPDETMKLCSATRNSPPAAALAQIQQSEKARIEYPSDGKFVGDWRAGESVAQSGYGLRFTDDPPRQANGGNCYACHQLSRQELSYGTLGPSLLRYGKLRNFSEADMKATYEKIYDPHVAFPCSNMPRFGVNTVLTIDQIKDLVAPLMSRDSPVNQ